MQWFFSAQDYGDNYNSYDYEGNTYYSCGGYGLNDGKLYDPHRLQRYDSVKNKYTAEFTWELDTCYLERWRYTDYIDSSSYSYYSNIINETWDGYERCKDTYDAATHTVTTKCYESHISHCNGTTTTHQATYKCGECGLHIRNGAGRALCPNVVPPLKKEDAAPRAGYSTYLVSASCRYLFLFFRFTL